MNNTDSELKEMHIELSKVSAVLDELRHFLFQQYEKRERENLAIIHVMDRIEKKLESLDTSQRKTRSESKPVKGQAKSARKKAVQAKKKSRSL